MRKLNDLFYIGYLGEVMITQVSGLNVNSVAKDPRRKAQSVQFKHSSRVAYKQNYENEYAAQQRKSLMTSIAIVAGAILVTIGYFVFSGLKQAKTAV